MLRFYPDSRAKNNTTCVLLTCTAASFNCPGFIPTSKTTNILHKMFSFWLHHNTVCVFWNVKSRQCNVKPSYICSCCLSNINSENWDVYQTEVYLCLYVALDFDIQIDPRTSLVWNPAVDPPNTQCNFPERWGEGIKNLTWNICILTHTYLEKKQEKHKHLLHCFKGTNVQWDTLQISLSCTLLFPWRN